MSVLGPVDVLQGMYAAYLAGDRASIDAAFRILGVKHLISIIHPENAASIRVAERLGETFERTWVLHGLELRIYGRAVE